MRRQAEKQQPVYRLILLCAPNLVAASCEAPSSLLSLSLCLTFLAAVSCMEAFPEQKQICLVLRHFLSLDPCLFVYHAQRGCSEKKNVLALLFVFCYTLLCFRSPVLFSTLWQTLNIRVTRGIFSPFLILRDFLACF